MVNDLVCPEMSLNKELWHPEQVAEDPHLTIDKKRALLAAFASDDRAVIGKPTLRQLPNGGIVTLASILTLLYKLGRNETATEVSRWHPHRRDRILIDTRRKTAVRRRRKQEDYDPPSSPTSCRVSRRQTAYA